MNNKDNLIVCPFCGAEYLPAEIFYPNNFLGKPKNIFKDEYGKLLYYTDTDWDNTETFICDHCNKEFKVTVKYNFTATDSDAINFDDSYETVIYKDRISLNEDDNKINLFEEEN